VSAVHVVDILAVGAHPDDVELGCGGLLLAMHARGYRFAIVDLTAGERGSRGSRDVRAREAKAAAELMGASGRECLGLPDTAVEATDAAVRLMADQLRKWRPQLVVSMHEGDQHPDHAACARIVARACFLGALRNYDAAGEPHRASRVIRYSRHPWFEPSFVVDITDFVEKKVEAVLCYRSQFTREEEGARTPISAPDFLEDLKASWPFAMDGPPALPDPVAALCTQRRDFA
jgi:bacillithiol biosynthesis deacetylase BshB1